MKNLSLFLFSMIIVLVACNPKTANKVVESKPLPPVVEEPMPTTKPEKPTPKAPVIEEEKVKLIASIKKTACYGTCPTFETKIYSDGRVTYYGKKNVERVGHYEAMLNDGFQAQIRDKAIAVKYFNLSKSYPANGRKIMDLPNTITSYQLNGKEHSIENNHEAPQELKEFEAFLMTMTQGLEWVKVNN